MHRFTLALPLLLITFPVFAQQETSGKPDLFVGLEGGYISTKISDINPDYDAFLGSAFKQDVSIFPGVFLHLRPQNKKFSVSIGMQRISYLFESQRTYRQGVDVNDHVMVAYNDVKIPLSFGVEFGNSPIRPFARFGAALNLYSGKQSERKKEVMLTPPVTQTEPAFVFVSHPLSATLDVGVQYEIKTWLAMLKVRGELAAAPLREYDPRMARANIRQQSTYVILAVGYNIGR